LRAFPNTNWEDQDVEDSLLVTSLVEDKIRVLLLVFLLHKSCEEEKHKEGEEEEEEEEEEGGFRRGGIEGGFGNGS